MRTISLGDDFISFTFAVTDGTTIWYQRACGEVRTMPFNLTNVAHIKYMRNVVRFADRRIAKAEAEKFIQKHLNSKSVCV